MNWRINQIKINYRDGLSDINNKVIYEHTRKADVDNELKPTKGSKWMCGNNIVKQNEGVNYLSRTLYN